jgi:hypothetical protein
MSGKLRREEYVLGYPDIKVIGNICVTYFMKIAKEREN